MGFEFVSECAVELAGGVEAEGEDEEAGEGETESNGVSLVVEAGQDMGGVAGGYV